MYIRLWVGSRPTYLQILSITFDGIIIIWNDNKAFAAKLPRHSAEAIREVIARAYRDKHGEDYRITIEVEAV